MKWHNVRFICLVELEIDTPGAEKGGEDEIEFTIRKTVAIGKSETLSFSIEPFGHQAILKIGLLHS